MQFVDSASAAEVVIKSTSDAMAAAQVAAYLGNKDCNQDIDIGSLKNYMAAKMLEAIIRNLKEITFREWEWRCSTYDIQVANVSIGAYAEQGMLGETKERVPGDIVEPKVGDKGAADMRVVEFICSTLRVEQGSLTGESEAVNKTIKPISENTDIQGKKSMVFAGPIVVNGNCLCLVAETGMSTEIGKVHMQIHVASQSEEDTPLKEKFIEFGEILKMITGVLL